MYYISIEPIKHTQLAGYFINKGLVFGENIYNLIDLFTRILGCYLEYSCP